MIYIYIVLLSYMSSKCFFLKCNNCHIVAKYVVSDHCTEYNLQSTVRKSLTALQLT